MKTRIAQLLTLALSAVGGLAILVGVINQPQALANTAGFPAAHTFIAAASSPAVSPLA